MKQYKKKMKHSEQIICVVLKIPAYLRHDTTETFGKWCQEGESEGTGGGRNMKESVSIVCVCVFKHVCWPVLTSELRLCMLWRAGHPVELFSPRLEECKPEASPFSLGSAKRDEEGRLGEKTFKDKFSKKTSQGHRG